MLSSTNILLHAENEQGYSPDQIIVTTLILPDWAIFQWNYKLKPHKHSTGFLHCIESWWIYNALQLQNLKAGTVYFSILKYYETYKKIQTLLIFREICENTAQVQWIKCSPSPYSLNECSIFTYRTQMNTVCTYRNQFLHLSFIRQFSIQLLLWTV